MSFPKLVKNVIFDVPSETYTLCVESESSVFKNLVSPLLGALYSIEPSAIPETASKGVIPDLKVSDVLLELVFKYFDCVGASEKYKLSEESDNDVVKNLVSVAADVVA